MTRPIIGITSVIGYCVVTALSSLVISASEQTYGPLLVTFSSITVTIIWFNGLQLMRISRLREVYLNHSRGIFLLNMTTAMMWIGTFLALDSLNPDVFTAILLGGLPVFIFIITSASSAWNKARCLELLFTIAIAGLLFMISYHELALSNYSSEILLGMIIAFFSSFFAAWTVILSHQLAHAGVSTTEILSQRFYVLWLVAGLALCIFPASFSFVHSMIIDYFPIAIAVAILSFILPLFLLQKGIERVDPMFVSFLSPLIPVMAFTLEMFSDRYVFDPIEMCLLIALALVIIGAAIVKVLSQESQSK